MAVAVPAEAVAAVAAVVEGAAAEEVPWVDTHRGLWGALRRLCTGVLGQAEGEIHAGEFSHHRGVRSETAGMARQLWRVHDGNVDQGTDEKDMCAAAAMHALCARGGHVPAHERQWPRRKPVSV